MATDQNGGGHGPAPLTQAYTLLNGRAVTFEMPDLFAMASGQADIPNAAQAEIYRLLYGDGEAVAPAQQLVNDQRYMRSLFYTAQLVIRPRVRLDDEEEGEIDRRELALSDLLAAFSFLRYGPPPALPAPIYQNDRADTETAPIGGDVPSSTE
jgi:hypothetical protein